MNSLEEIWEAACDYCRKEISEAGFNTWLKPLTPLDVNDKEVVLQATSVQQRNIVDKIYLGLLKRAFISVFGFPIAVRLTVQDEPDAPKPQKPADRMAGETASEYTFDNFVVGPSNRFAHAAALAVANNPGSSYNPLFIYGNSGLGKTHLLNAICNGIKENFPSKTVVYTQGEAFANEIISAIQDVTTASFREKYRKADVLLIDDIQFIAGKDSTQTEFFNTFEALYQDKKQIILTSDRSPKEIKMLEERIRYRFEMGLLADIKQPDFETRVAIIHRKAEQLDFDLPEDLVQFIANQLKHNVRQLEGIVHKLYAYYKLTGDYATVASVAAAVSEIRNNDNPVPMTIDRIIGEVSRSFGVSVADICSQKRNMEISEARHVAIYIAREVTQQPLKTIGKSFDNRNHSTISTSIQKVENDMKRDPKLRAQIEDIINNISG